MKFFVLVIVCVFTTAAPEEFKDIFATELQLCDNNEDVIADYQQALYSFSVQVYKNIGSKVHSNFVFAPLSIWIILAAIAEGVDSNAKLSMFQILRLPIDPCVRLRYYQLATSRYGASDDVSICNTRALVIDKEVTINPTYHNFLLKYSLLDVISAPIQHDPQTTLKEIRRVISAKLPNFDLHGNSLILDAVDYNGIWSTAFQDAIVERSPFYSRTGEQVGTVDLMKVRRRVRRTYIRSLNIKGIELPIGYNSRYRMTIGVILDNNVARAINMFENSVLDQYLSSVQESLTPIDISIPRFNITSEFDLKNILEDLGVNNLRIDPTVNGSVSGSTVLPSGYLHRATMSLDTAGLEPTPSLQQTPYDIRTSDPVIGQEFIANRPFLLALFDAETYTCVMTTVFTQPTYEN